MVEAIAYSIQRLFFRVYEFFVHWYGHGFIKAVDRTLSVFHMLDRTLALRVTLKHFWQPLYQDYTTLGYILGFVFRTIRVVIGVAVYGCVAVLALSLYILWAAVPAYLIYRVIFS